jgi:ADP-ribosyl-[dinitrogen reductase] hydrolase
MREFFPLNNIAGMLEGVAIGDALGAAHEFKASKAIYTGSLEHKPEFFTRFQGKKHMVVGQFTDDTEMTLTLARSLVRNKKYNKNDVILSYEKWANSCSTLGKNTRYLFKGVKTIRGYEQRYRIAMDRAAENESDKELIQSLSENQSNGSLMRSTPLALLSDINDIIADTDLTNPNNVNRECTLLYTQACRFLAQGYPLIKVFENIEKAVSIREVAKILEEVRNLLDERGCICNVRNVQGKQKGWVLHAFYFAMVPLLYFDSHFLSNFSMYIDWVIQQKGDTDTNAAIAGGLLGAYLGHNKMIEDSRLHNNLCIMFAADTKQGDYPRDAEYTLTDIYVLSEDLYRIFGFHNIA